MSIDDESAISQESKLTQIPKLRLLLLTSKDVALTEAEDRMKKDEQPLSGESNEKAIQTDKLQAIKRTPSDQGRVTRCADDLEPNFGCFGDQMAKTFGLFLTYLGHFLYLKHIFGLFLLLAIFDNLHLVTLDQEEAQCSFLAKQQEIKTEENISDNLTPPITNTIG